MAGNGLNVMNRRAARARHDAERQNEARQWLLVRRVKEAFRLKRAETRLIERIELTLPQFLDGFRVQLVDARFFVDGHSSRTDHLHAVRKAHAEAECILPVDDAAEFRAAVLQGKVNMPARVILHIGELALHAKSREQKILAEQIAHIGIELRHRINRCHLDQFCEDAVHKRGCLFSAEFLCELHGLIDGDFLRNVLVEAELEAGEAEYRQLHTPHLPETPAGGRLLQNAVDLLALVENGFDALPAYFPLFLTEFRTLVLFVRNFA